MPSPLKPQQEPEVAVAKPKTATAHTAMLATALPKAAKLVPFLRKVQILCETAPPNTARWSADGKQFDVLDPKGFDELLKVHFEGAAPATFHRQLFFYGWVKLNHSNGGGDERTKGTWSFRHPSFLRDEPSKIYEIKRFARASDREEQEDGSRVDILERRVSALQSLVDDLSRKLAAVQMTLNRTPLPVIETAHPLVEKPGRKRMKDIDEDFLNDDLRLSEDDILNLFDESSFAKDPFTDAEDLYEPTQHEQSQVSALSQVEQSYPSQPVKSNNVHKSKQDHQAQQAQEFLSSLMSTPQFHAVITSSIQEKPAPKVESVPHLSVC